MLTCWVTGTCDRQLSNMQQTERLVYTEVTIYIYIYIYTHVLYAIYIYVVCIYIYIYLYVCMYVYIYIYIYVTAELCHLCCFSRKDFSPCGCRRSLYTCSRSPSKRLDSCEDCLRMNGVNTNGAAAKTNNFDRLGKKERPGTL